MDFNLTTFVLELINFGVLVWLLQRLLYKPVLRVIARRQQQIQSQINEAHSKQSEASQLLQQYQQRIDDWEQEKTQLKVSLQAELRIERETQLCRMQKEIEDERQRFLADASRRHEEDRQKCEQKALGLAADFLAKTFADLTSAELEKKIHAIFIHDLNQLIEKDEYSSNGKSLTNIDVISAFPILPEDRAAIENQLNRYVRSNANYSYTCDTKLLAGIKVIIGGTLLQINLQDAATFFRRLEDNDGRK
ncbi:MAG TPA: F0F1 ATP synthase subunit delta [Oculatellaceae cyanobacterium]